MSDLPDKELTRRGFLTRVGGGIIATNVAGTAPQSPDDRAAGPRSARQKTRLGHRRARQPGASTRSCRPSPSARSRRSSPWSAAIRDKANKLAARYGVNPKNIYNYENYDTLKDNPEVDVIYIVLPNSMHAEYTIRGAAGRQARALREADGQHARRLPGDDRRRARRPTAS